MPDLDTSVAMERAAIVAEALDAFVADLRLVDPGDIIGYIRAAQWANIADLVQSSAELSFRDDALLFGCGADFTLDWTSAPSIALDMEFRGDAISAFFTLHIHRVETTVALQHVWFAIEPDTAGAGTQALATAMARARHADHPVTEARPNWRP